MVSKENKKSGSSKASIIAAALGLLGVGGAGGYFLHANINSNNTEQKQVISQAGSGNSSTQDNSKTIVSENAKNSQIKGSGNTVSENSQNVNQSIGSGKIENNQRKTENHSKTGEVRNYEAPVQEIHNYSMPADSSRDRLDQEKARERVDQIYKRLLTIYEEYEKADDCGKEQSSNTLRAQLKQYNTAAKSYNRKYKIQEYEIYSPDQFFPLLIPICNR